MNTAATDYDGKNKYIRITDIDETSHLYLENNAVSPLDKPDEKFLVNDDDILFARTGASVGKSYKYSVLDGILYFAGFLIRVNVNKANCNFIFNQTLSKKYEKWVNMVSMRSGQPGINAEEYKTMPISLTEIKEQEKISSFLLLLDEKTQKQQQLVELLKKYKKGLLHQIFFEKTHPNWNRVKLQDIAEFCGGGTPSKNIPSYWTGTIGWISSSDLYEDWIDELSITRRINSSAVNDSATKLCPKGTIAIVTRVGVGKVAIMPEELCTSQDFVNLISIRGNNIFLAYQIAYKLKIEAAKAQGTSIKGLTTETIKQLELDIPTLQEQSYIAKMLSNFDYHVKLEIQKLDCLGKLKKSLLQQLFI